MSQQWITSVHAERLARSMKALAEMINTGCSEESVRTLAWEAGIDSHTLDQLYAEILGCDVDPPDLENFDEFMEAQ